MHHKTISNHRQYHAWSAIWHSTRTWRKRKIQDQEQHARSAINSSLERRNSHCNSVQRQLRWRSKPIQTEHELQLARGRSAKSQLTKRNRCQLELNPSFSRLRSNRIYRNGRYTNSLLHSNWYIIDVLWTRVAAAFLHLSRSNFLTWPGFEPTAFVIPHVRRPQPK